MQPFLAGAISGVIVVSVATFTFWWYGARRFLEIWQANSGWAAAIAAAVGTYITAVWLKRHYDAMKSQLAHATMDQDVALMDELRKEIQIIDIEKASAFSLEEAVTNLTNAVNSTGSKQKLEVSELQNHIENFDRSKDVKYSGTHRFKDKNYTYSRDEFISKSEVLFTFFLKIFSNKTEIVFDAFKDNDGNLDKDNFLKKLQSQRKQICPFENKYFIVNKNNIHTTDKFADILSLRDDFVTASELRARELWNRRKKINQAEPDD